VKKVSADPVRVPPSGRITLARVSCPTACTLSKLSGRVRVRQTIRGKARIRVIHARTAAPRQIAAGGSARVRLIVPRAARRHLIKGRKSGLAVLALSATSKRQSRLTRGSIRVGIMR
jgi:hypothetical protein